MKKYIVLTKDYNLEDDTKLKLFSTKEKAINFYNKEVKRLFEDYEITKIIENEKTNITKMDGFYKFSCYNFSFEVDFEVKILEIEEE